MKLLDRYLLGQFGRNLLLIGSSLIAVYLLVDFFERIDNFLAAGKPFSMAVQYFLLKIPQIFDQLMPVCVLLAGITTLGLLNRHHEFVALKAAGISVSRIVAPLLAGALLVTGLGLMVGQWLLPPTVSATNRIYYQNVQKRIPTGIIRDGRTYHHGRQGIYSFKRPDLTKNHFLDFAYVSWDDAYRMELLLTARTADWQEGRWRFTDGQSKRLQADGEYLIQLFQTSDLPLPDAPETFFVPEYKVNEYSLSELYAQARATTTDDRSGLIDFHRRLSYIFLGLPLLLLGIPVLLTVQEHRGRDLALAIPVSCGLAFGAWGWWSMAQSLARTSALHPALLSWSIHLLASALGLYFIRRQDQ
ncbi:MAG: LptF/LptG family permease [Desulfobulbaceae bacterium]|nr:LptF/LptG family permease [Desulfobulbaceae bacterium]